MKWLDLACAASGKDVKIQRAEAITSASQYLPSSHVVNINPVDQLGWCWQVTRATGLREPVSLFTVATGPEAEDVEIGDPLDCILYHELWHGVHDLFRGCPKQARQGLVVLPVRDWATDYPKEEAFTTEKESLYRQETGRTPRVSHETGPERDNVSNARILAGEVGQPWITIKPTAKDLKQKKEGTFWFELPDPR